MATKNVTADKEQLERILESRKAMLDRSREVEEQLAALGVRLGGYRLDPPLGGPGFRPFKQPQVRRDSH